MQYPKDFTMHYPEDVKDKLEYWKKQPVPATSLSAAAGYPRGERALRTAIRESCKKEWFDICPFYRWPHTHVVYQLACTLQEYHCLHFTHMDDASEFKRLVADVFGYDPLDIWPPTPPKIEQKPTHTLDLISVVSVVGIVVVAGVVIWWLVTTLL